MAKTYRRGKYTPVVTIEYVPCPSDRAFAWWWGMRTIWTMLEDAARNETLAPEVESERSVGSLTVTLAEQSQAAERIDLPQ